MTTTNEYLFLRHHHQRAAELSAVAKADHKARKVEQALRRQRAHDTRREVELQATRLAMMSSQRPTR
ncbi:MAG: hypothetical protein ACRDQA_14100 [Nocardioidaceae bacterium]